jgi:hypothetical protein
VFPGAAANVSEPVVPATSISPACAGIETMIASAEALAVDSSVLIMMNPFSFQSLHREDVDSLA